MPICFSILLCVLGTILKAQVQLGPCINSGQLPGGGDSIQPVVSYIDTTQQFTSGGFQAGQTVDDFILYDQTSVQYQLSQILNSGKPVLLVSGSYSCPAYRYSMDQVLPDIVAIFDTNVVFLIVYQLEAHPVGPDYSPFSDTVFTTNQNYTDGILIPQHRIYADRINRAVQSEAALGSCCPVLLDGPGNEFWSTFGPSPNNAYLITPDGWVYAKFGWLMNSKYLCIADINQLLASVGVESHTENSELILPVTSIGNSSLQLQSVTAQEIDMIVHDETGREILHTEIAAEGEYPLGAALPSKGIYFISLIAGDRSQIITFVKAD